MVFAFLFLLQICSFIPPFVDSAELSEIITSNDLLVISSDDDFEAHGWSGNGTAVNPYLLSQEEFEGEGYLIIRNTRNHFRIENCTFDMDFIAMDLDNVTNAVIYNNTILTKSTGIDLSHCDSVMLLENWIQGGGDSFYIWYSNNISVLNNTVGCIRRAVLLSDTTNSTLIGNQLATVDVWVTAEDKFGLNNSWDDGVSQGNAWYNYDGSGTYQIRGSTNSTDHFPTIFEPPFPVDYEGPDILTPRGWVYIDYTHESSLPSFWTFEAEVSDPSGVDIVIITINGGEYQMVHQPTNETPDRYIYNYPNPRTMTYSFWAIDTLGFSSEEPGGFISLGVFPFGGPDPVDEQTMVLFYGIGAAAIIFVVTVVFLARRKKTILLD